MFVINEKLREDVTSNIPEVFTPRQKLICAYKRLCEKLEYSMPAYINTERHEGFYRNPSKLELIDGETRRDIMCYSFAAIFSEIVRGMNLPHVFTYPPKLGKNKIFDPDHTSLRVFFDGDELEFDPLGGVIDNNDMNNVKFGLPVAGISVNYARKGTTKKKLEKEIMNDISVVCTTERSPKHHLALEFEKVDEYDFSDLDFERRLAIFMRKLSEIDEPVSAVMLNYIIRLKRMLFLKSEDCVNFDLKFLSDIKNDHKLVFVSANPKGYEKIKGKENFDSLTVTMFDFYSHKIVTFSRDEALEIEKNPNLCIDSSSKYLKFHFLMASDGLERVSQSGNQHVPSERM
ncbi:MAG: hypothetical protein IJW24_00595 [Clostridia bacterium]|nr:hypothetical protein [Clostridia bacterium]